jgi:ribosome-associated translation inhibitor RaiA
LEGGRMKQHQDTSELIKIKYQGLHPSETLSNFLQTEMEAIHKQAPFDAMLNAQFMRLSEHDYKANILITSSAGEFFATAHGKNLNESVNKTTEQIHRQLDRWKTHIYEVGDPRSFRSGYGDPT